MIITIHPSSSFNRQIYMVNCQIINIYFRPQLFFRKKKGEKKKKKKCPQNPFFLSGFVVDDGEGKEVS